MKVLRNRAAYTGILNGLGIFTDNFTSTGGGAITFETQMTNILLALAWANDGTGWIAGVIATSTAHPGTQKATFTAVAGKSYQCLVIGTDGFSTTLGTVASTGTIDDPEIY